MTGSFLPPDPYTWQTRLCDDDGLVSDEIAHSGPGLTLTYLDVHHNLRVQTRPGCDRITKPFHCTGSAHLAGMHIRCTSPAHKANRIAQALDD